MFGLFSIKSFMIFYIFFEGSLLPIFFLVVGWGYNPEKLRAGIYILFYTILASIPLIVGLIKLYNNIGVGEFIFYFYLRASRFILGLIMIIGFIVKLPVVFFHY